jgi:hypothetical protein
MSIKYINENYYVKKRKKILEVMTIYNKPDSLTLARVMHDEFYDILHKYDELNNECIMFEIMNITDIDYILHCSTGINPAYTNPDNHINMARVKTFIRNCAPFLKRFGTINSGTCDLSCNLWIDVTTNKICASACQEMWFAWNVADSKKDLIEMYYKYCELCENKNVRKHTRGFIDCLVFDGFGSHIDIDEKSDQTKKDIIKINKMWKTIQKKNTKFFLLSEIEDTDPFIGYM